MSCIPTSAVSGQDGRVPGSPDAPTKGFLSTEPDELARRTIRGWELFLDAVEGVDLNGPSRSRKRGAREMVVGLGTWPDSRGIPDIVADARAGRPTTEPFADASKRLFAAHRAATDAQVLGSIVESLVQTRQWFEQGVLESDGDLLTPSALGPLPVGTVLHMALYQLAITVRDLAPAGAPGRPELDALGLAALLDSSAAVAARIGLTASAAAIGDQVAVSIDIANNGWISTRADNPAFPGVFGPEGVMLDLAAGRADLKAMLRRLRFRNPRGMLALAPVVDDVPDLPGGPLLRQIARWARVLGR